jgi:hypothetical protein
MPPCALKIRPNVGASLATGPADETWLDIGTRRLIRSRLLMSERTATRTFDLRLAIATLQLPAPALCRDWNESERFR